MFISQLTRFCWINKTIKYFEEDVKVLVSKLTEQNFDVQMLRDKFVEFTKHKFKIWSKSGRNMSNNSYIDKLFRLKIELSACFITGFCFQIKFWAYVW